MAQPDPMNVRRVRTGRTHEGKSIYVADEEVSGFIPPLLGGNEVVRLWGSDEPVKLPTDGAVPEFMQNFYPPIAGALRFTLWRMPPRGCPAPEISDQEEATRITEEMVPQMLGVIEHREDAHATDTIDLLYLVSGACDLELDDGAKTTLHAGDFLVQNNTNHAWSNPYDEDCLLVLVMYGAVPAEQ